MAHITFLLNSTILEYISKPRILEPGKCWISFQIDFFSILSLTPLYKALPFPPVLVIFALSELLQHLGLYVSFDSSNTNFVFWFVFLCCLFPFTSGVPVSWDFASPALSSGPYMLEPLKYFRKV